MIVSEASCVDTASISVIVNPSPSSGACCSDTIASGSSAALTASGGGTYSWSNGGTDSTIFVSPSAETIYCVTVTNANGCTDISCDTIFVEQLDCASAGELYLPNAFSPNGDGENDSLQVYYGNFLCIKTLNIVIYNRWGNKVFQADDPSFEWDGNFQGKKLDSGAYTYYMEVTYIYPSPQVDGLPEFRKGTIYLMR